MKQNSNPIMNLIVHVFAMIFMIFWCAGVARGGAWLMLLFGLFGLGLTTYRLVAYIRTMKHSKTEEQSRELDPWERPVVESSSTSSAQSSSNAFCPYCNSPIETDFNYCPKCGRKLDYRVFY